MRPLRRQVGEGAARSPGPARNPIRATRPSRPPRPTAAGCARCSPGWLRTPASPEPEVLARHLHLLYDGSGQSAGMDDDPTAATAAHAAAATLLDATLARGTAARPVG